MTAGKSATITSAVPASAKKNLQDAKKKQAIAVKKTKKAQQKKARENPGKWIESKLPFVSARGRKITMCSIKDKDGNDVKTKYFYGAKCKKPTMGYIFVNNVRVGTRRSKKK